MIKIRLFKYVLTATALCLSSSYAFSAELSGTVSSKIVPSVVNTNFLSKIEKKKFLESFLVSPDNGLANVIVYIKSLPKKYSAEQLPNIMKMNGNQFIPKVMPVVAGSNFTVVNDDNHFHNVHGVQGNKNIFIVNLPKFGQKTTHRLEKEGVVSIKCETHLVMLANVLVLNNPFFATTNSHGKFTIPAIPPGSYELVVWHELMGTKKVQVHLSKNTGSKQVNFTYEKVANINRIYDNN